MKKRNYICLIILLILFLNIKKDVNIEYIDESELFATLDDHKIYIGTGEEIDAILAMNDDVYIVDQREGDDPNFLVYDSYRIRSVEEISSLVDILLEYERMYPSNWERSRKTLIREWVFHNISYNLNYKHDHTKDVDLNNGDEDKYSIQKTLKKILFPNKDNL